MEYSKNALYNLYSEQHETFESSITSNYLLEKLKKRFGDELQVITMHNKKIIAPREGSVISEETFSQFEESEILDRASFILRKKILSIKRKSLPAIITALD